MKKLLLFLTILFPIGLFPQVTLIGSKAVPVPNAGSTGTTLNKLAKLTGTGTAVLAAITDTNGIIGICANNCTTTGNASIARFGLQACVFDGATTANDYVQISSTVAGDCHDTGATTYPSSGQVIGRILSTNGGGGTFVILMAGPEIQASAGGGGGLPAGPTTPDSVPQVLSSTPSSGVAGSPAWGLSGIPTNAQAGTTYTVVATDRIKFLTFTNASPVAVTLPQAGSSGFTNKFAFIAKNLGAGDVTITPTASTIAGASTLVVHQGEACTVYSDDTNYFTSCNAGQLVAGTNVTLTHNATGTTINSSGGGGGVGPGTPSQVAMFNTTSNVVGDTRLTYQPASAKNITNSTTVAQPFGWIKFLGISSTPLWPADPNTCMPFFDLNTGIMKGLTSTGANCNATLPLGPTSPNSVPQILTSTPSGGVAGAATWGLAGVPVNAQTGTTYTMLATDRASYVSFNNAGAIAVTLPDATSANFTSNYTFVACDLGAGTATISRTSTSTISYTNGSTFTNGATSLALATGQCAWFYSDNTNYFAIVRSGAGISGLTTSKIPKAASATTLTDSSLDDGLTTATDLTYSGAGGIVASGATGNVIANGGLFAGANAALTAITAAITPGGNVQMGSTGVLGIGNGGNLATASIDTGHV
jgi:hypothetical protein